MTEDRTIIKQTNIPRIVENIRGGSGKAKIFDACADLSEGPIALASRIVLEPGASIGLHCHNSDEEVYAIAAGKGIYKTEDACVQALPGDIFTTKQGMSHAIQNDDEEEDLVLFAIVGRHSQ